MISKSKFTIGFFPDEEDKKDFLATHDLCAEINDINISLRKLNKDQLLADPKHFSEIPVYIVVQSLFDKDEYKFTLKKLATSKFPVICLLDNSSPNNVQNIDPTASDFWLYKDTMNHHILRAILLKAEKQYRLKEQNLYLRSKFHESEKRFLGLIRSKAEAVIVLNTNGMVRFINPACEIQFGLKREKWLGSVFPYSVKAGQIRELDLLPLTGEEKIVEMVVSELIWENELCLTVTLHDMTEQKRIEERLLTFQQVIMLSPLPIVITDRDANILYANNQFQKATGYNIDELIGKKTSLLKSGMHDKVFYQDLWSTILAGNSWVGQICNRMKNGQLYWEKQLISPVKNNRGEIIYFFSLRVEDIEKRRKEKALQNEEALRNVQELAGGIAHEFSQPLQVLSISMALLENEAQGSEYFEKANKMIRRIIELVDHLKSITSLRKQDYLTSKILDIKASSQRNIEKSKVKRILIIDDEPELLESLTDLLKMSGYNVDGASSGPQALDCLGRNNYYIIISDVDMPRMSGTELFRKIKETGYKGYFVFMTGYEMNSDLEMSIKMADAFLTKPFNLRELKDLVDRLYTNGNTQKS